jgi:hypothetical protein
MQELLNITSRFGRKNKNKFLNMVEQELTSYGYECQMKSFWRLLRSVNLETQIENPRYLFIAHYDTGTIMPFWMHGLMRLLGINRQILMILLMVLFIKILLPYIEEIQPIVATTLSMLLFIPLLGIFIPNPFNHDDNTSGVIALLRIAKMLKEQRVNDVKFVFVDNEELGLFGSASHKGYLKRKKLISKGCKVISIDCVGGKGEIPLVIKNGQSDYAKDIASVLQQTFGTSAQITMILPASDNFSFREFGAVNISMVSKSIVPGGYYIPHIHTFRDNKFNAEKVERLATTMVDFVTNDRG